MSTKTTNLRFNMRFIDDERAMLDELSDRLGMTHSEIMRRALRDLYEFLRPKNSRDCPRCNDTGQIRNDGFVWVKCPECNHAQTQQS